jgi:hypothetical protein
MRAAFTWVTLSNHDLAWAIAATPSHIHDVGIRGQLASYSVAFNYSQGLRPFHAGAISSSTVVFSRRLLRAYTMLVDVGCTPAAISYRSSWLFSSSSCSLHFVVALTRQSTLSLSLRPNAFSVANQPGTVTASRHASGHSLSNAPVPPG